MNPERPLLLATETSDTRNLAQALDAELSPLPSLDEPEQFASWRAATSAGPKRAQIVVAAWIEKPTQGELSMLAPDQWRARFELPFLLWNFALGAAGERCADGGAIVAIVQAPAALDAPGWTPEVSVADGVLALVRSVAATQGPRAVRANLIETPIGLVSGEVIAPRPPLDRFPGRVEQDVAGAARMLLSADAIGLTGRLLTADGGRSL